MNIPNDVDIEAIVRLAASAFDYGLDGSQAQKTKFYKNIRYIGCYPTIKGELTRRFLNEHLEEPPQ